MISVTIEAETHEEFVEQWLAVTRGFREPGGSSAPVLALVPKQEAVADTSEAQDAADDAAAGKQRRIRRTKAEMERDRAAEAAPGALTGESVPTAVITADVKVSPQVTEAQTPRSSGAPVAAISATSALDDDPFAPDATDEGEDPNTPHVADYDLRLISYKAANQNATAYDFIFAELQRYCDKHGGRQAKEGLEAVRALVVGFGYPRITQVPAEKYPELLALIDKGMVASKAA